MARRKTSPRRGGSRGRRRSSSFLQRYPRLGVVDRLERRLSCCMSFCSIISLSVQPVSDGVRFYGDAEYPEGYEIHGIDISHYQGKIDWEQLKNAMIKGCPVRFVIIKSTEGSSGWMRISARTLIRLAISVSSGVFIISGAISRQPENRLIIS